MDKKIRIIGAGLAGCEAAWQIANRGIKVELHEMRGSGISTQAHQTNNFAELVCSNSFRNDDIESAIGLLHQEMRMMGSLIMENADANKVPAGSALAMDRELFSQSVHSKICSHPNITVSRGEITKLPLDNILTIIATGPLTSDTLSADIIKYTGHNKLAFFDAIAPIIYKDSINFDIAWLQSRYDKSGPGGMGKDYVNCPLNKEQYYNFIHALLSGDKTEFKDWEKNTPYFDGCLPIEVMAERGKDTLLFGPMKPVGLTNPNGEQSYAVVQLRQDNKLGTLYNMVGFQTKLKYGAQEEIFKMIPGLENAAFARLGGIHRNSFIKSPELLDSQLRLKIKPSIRFAGQITGVEGYVESAAIGMLAGIFAAYEMLEQSLALPPEETALGALLAHITKNAHKETFQPMNINYGLFPPLGTKFRKIDKKKLYADRALKYIETYKNNLDAY